MPSSRTVSAETAPVTTPYASSKQAHLRLAAKRLRASTSPCVKRRSCAAGRPDYAQVTTIKTTSLYARPIMINLDPKPHLQNAREDLAPCSSEPAPLRWTRRPPSPTAPTALYAARARPPSRARWQGLRHRRAPLLLDEIAEQRHPSCHGFQGSGLRAWGWD